MFALVFCRFGAEEAKIIRKLTHGYHTIIPIYFPYKYYPGVDQLFSANSGAWTGHCCCGHWDIVRWLEQKY